MNSGLVHILDDDVDYCDSLAQLVRSLGFHILSYSSAGEYLQSDEHAPGCLILDLQLRGQSGLAILPELAKRPHPHPVIVLTGNADVAAVVNSYRSEQVVAFLQKQSLNELDLLEAIQKAMALDFAQRTENVRHKEVRNRILALSTRDRQVLEMILKGAEHQQIATELNVSRRTVENRRENIMKKLGAKNLPELLRMVLEVGLP